MDAPGPSADDGGCVVRRETSPAGPTSDAGHTPWLDASLMKIVRLVPDAVSTTSCDETCSLTNSTVESVLSECCSASVVCQARFASCELGRDNPTCAVCESSLQASFAEQTAREMNEIMQWWKSVTDNASQTHAIPRNSLLLDDADEAEDQGVEFCDDLPHVVRLISGHTDNLNQAGVRKVLRRVDWMLRCVAERQVEASSIEAAHKESLSRILPGTIPPNKEISPTVAIRLTDILPRQWMALYIWTLRNGSLPARLLVRVAPFLVLMAALWFFRRTFHPYIDAPPKVSLVCYPPLDVSRVSLEYNLPTVEDAWLL